MALYQVTVTISKHGKIFTSDRINFNATNVLHARKLTSHYLQNRNGYYGRNHAPFTMKLKTLKLVTPGFKGNPVYDPEAKSDGLNF